MYANEKNIKDENSEYSQIITLPTIEEGDYKPSEPVIAKKWREDAGDNKKQILDNGDGGATCRYVPVRGLKKGKKCSRPVLKHGYCVVCLKNSNVQLKLYELGILN